ncbi:MAG: hypothetical protein HOP04_14295 [Methylophilaceae bacterium]|nr:hypothetical protein [Methylophilaceae bacterium]
MTTNNLSLPIKKWEVLFFTLIQVSVMLIAISNESLWIDEFWNAYFASLGSVNELYELLLIPSGSQTPLHFAYNYFWGLFFQPSELGLRLSNLPLFVLAQLSLYWALRAYPKKFSYLFLVISALHPLVWQYANEARPYIMIYAGSEMILAYLLHMHAIKFNGGRISPLFSAIFVFGSILLFGASLLGVFWVFAACLYVAYFHFQHLDWRYLKRVESVILLGLFLAATSLLTIYYLNNLIHGGGASRISATTAATLMFDAYELLGLSGIGPGRLEVRESGLASLSPYWLWLIASSAIILATLIKGLQEATKLLGSKKLLLVGALGLLPLIIVIISGFAMHWRVLGRHMIAELPLLNLLFALGLAKLFEKKAGRNFSFQSILAIAFLSVLVYSSCSLRFADRHRKDDYRAAATIAKQEFSKGQRVWWAADALGARYYKLPGEFDFMGELTSIYKPYECIDQPGVLSVSAATGECLETLSPPDVVILSKPETYDRAGVIVAYLEAMGFEKTQTLPAFTIWRKSHQAN